MTYSLKTDRYGNTIAVPVENGTPPNEDPATRRYLDEIWAREEAQERRDWEAHKHSYRADRGIPRRVWKYLDGGEKTAATEAVRTFMDDDARVFLVLAGGLGTGKTVAAAKALDGPKGRGRFVKASDLTRASTYDEDYWDLLRRTSCLVIDDLGTEPRDEKGWAAANLETLLDHRYDWELKTILTTNLPVDKFKATYCAGTGVRTLDRLRESGDFVTIAGESMRRPQPQPREPGEDDA